MNDTIGIIIGILAPISIFIILIFFAIKYSNKLRREHYDFISKQVDKIANSDDSINSKIAKLELLEKLSRRDDDNS